MQIDITTVITAHAEGSLIHATCMSVKEAIDFAGLQGIKNQVLVIIDKGSTETIEYFNEQAFDWLTVSSVDFGDPGASRNFAGTLATGKYIAFVDGDDLWSHNWLTEAFRFCQSDNRDIICHPAMNLYFGTEEPIVFFHEDSEDDIDKWNLIYSNYWTGLFFTKTSILQKHPQSVINIKSGLGFEDWHWHCETLANNIPHKVVNNTIHFIRKKPDGVLARSVDIGCVLPPTNLFLQLASEAQQKTHSLRTQTKK
tara:strand:- start:355 stop:1116 length:762 start_codon:yes stop_codon:yes gene_type:complete